MEIKSPIKAIRAFCLSCSGDSPKEVKLCNSKNCALHPFRFGRNPYIKKREYTEEELAEMRERLEKARENRK